ncbi:MAG: flagellar type III secretion system protein FliR [Rhizobiales bacterium]|nr:flagellar type III secretion system protein FliR [Hyphomicrobiales bacterium]NRB13813.1 flagellar type III secretion system protein FliR [Hyphomicrobiales bacterium]
MIFSFLPQLAFVYLLLFARIGAIIMQLPGFGETYVSVRIRLVFALLLTLVFFPMLNANFANIPPTLNGVFLLLIQELLIGLFIGASIKLFMSALGIAGTVISMQTGLGSAMSFDPTQGSQAPFFSTMLNLAAVTLIFVSDLHHLFFSAMIDSYTLFPTDGIGFLPIGDFAAMAMDSISKSFYLAMQLSAPFILYGVVFNVGLGILAKLMPQIQIYFVAMPANIGIGFVLIMLLFASMILWFLDSFGIMMQGFVL